MSEGPATAPAHPGIARAIPRRRYRIGEFSAVVLDEIESRDDVAYRYIMALVREGERDPVLSVALEQDADGGLSLRVIVANDARRYPVAAALADIEAFTAAALDAAVRLFKLQDEQAFRIL